MQFCEFIFKELSNTVYYIIFQFANNFGTKISYIKCLCTLGCVSGIILNCGCSCCHCCVDCSFATESSICFIIDQKLHHHLVVLLFHIFILVIINI